MHTLGIHLILDGWGCPSEVLNDIELVERALVEAVKAGGATLIDSCSHQFSPHGVTATATLAESHIAIHTWPEYGYFGADLFFCGDRCDPYAAVEPIRGMLRATQVRLTELKRGLDSAVLPRIVTDV